MRILTAGERTALAADRVRMCFLVELHFAIGTARFTTAAHTLMLGGVEWLGAGGLLDLELPQEDGTLEAHKAEITLNGLDPAVISLALNEDLEGTPAYIHLATFNPDTNQLIGTHQYLRGTVGQVRIVPPSMSEQ